MEKSDALKIQKERGFPAPLGSSFRENGVNFALFSEHATTVTLCLFSPNAKTPFAEIPLDPHLNCTGQVWHILLKNLSDKSLEYGFRVDGPKSLRGSAFDPRKILLDPYAKGLNTTQKWGCKNTNSAQWPPRGKVILDAPFDWQGTRPPRIPVEKLIIYEMHVRGFTNHPSSQTTSPGTFLGIVEKIPYLKSLGINAIELMPIFEFDECENERLNPKTQEKLKNVWGYSTINYFSPMNRYSASQNWTGALDDFRTLVREMHKNGIEVYLDVVYNHTAEGSSTGPLFSFKGIDNQVYYMLDPEGKYLDFSGTGNTLNANHPVVCQLILDSLRYWVSEMHVDGFRFDLASCLTRNAHGIPLPNPPLIEAMTADPILANVKMIAEAWDAGGLYQVGTFPGGKRWFEWNGQYRDVIRRFIKGTENQAGSFAKAMSGSEELYALNGFPYNSINFITAHDGFTLCDLVSYQNKHNIQNAESNRDGTSENDSWNCGCEGPTNDPQIIQLRERQMRNLHVALMVAIGTPMILMGDEYGHTKNGNNNSYCQDNILNDFLWDKLKHNEGFVRFHKLMIQLRKENPLLHRTEFLDDTDVSWHSQIPYQPNWGKESRFVAYTLNDKTGSEHLYIAFNAGFEEVQIQLPQPPERKQWRLIVDTSKPSPQDFCENSKSLEVLKGTYKMMSYSALIAKGLE